MARIRTIKPEFFTSADIVALSPLARLLYIALWCEADKEGRMVWKPKTFKLRYLPGDGCDVEALCEELVAHGLVRLYGEGLAWIPSFTRHQHVNPRESASDLPAPEDQKPSLPRKVGKSTREAVFERDGYACVRCGATDGLTIDHILPQSCGGPHIPENLRTLCRTCNSARPVSGDGLKEDLAMDGHTIETLRVKFGIDASIPDAHAQVGKEGKGREGKGKEERVEARASRFALDSLPSDWGDFCRQERQDLDPFATFDRFRDYWRSVPGAKGRKLDWPATWRNWVRNERADRPKAKQSPDEVAAEAIRLMEQRDAQARAA